MFGTPIIVDQKRILTHNMCVKMYYKEMLANKNNIRDGIEFI
jgi:hypothetical protein